MADEKTERLRFRIEVLMAIATISAVLVTAYQAKLSRDQFRASENHLLEDRRASVKPFLAVNTASLSKDAESGKWDRDLEIINLGRGIALDVRVTWMAPDRQILGNVGDRRHLLPGDSLKLTSLPQFLEEITKSERPEVWTHIKIKLQATAVDGGWFASQQSLDVEFDPQTKRITLNFAGIEVETLDSLEGTI